MKCKQKQPKKPNMWNHLSQLLTELQAVGGAAQGKTNTKYFTICLTQNKAQIFLYVCSNILHLYTSPTTHTHTHTSDILSRCGGRGGQSGSSTSCPQPSHTTRTTFTRHGESVCPLSPNATLLSVSPGRAARRRRRRGAVRVNMGSALNGSECDPFVLSPVKSDCLSIWPDAPDGRFSKFDRFISNAQLGKSCWRCVMSKKQDWVLSVIFNAGQSAPFTTSGASC